MKLTGIILAGLLAGCASVDDADLNEWAQSLTERCLSPLSECTSEEYRLATYIEFAGPVGEFSVLKR